MTKFNHKEKEPAFLRPWRWSIWISFVYLTRLFVKKSFVPLRLRCSLCHRYAPMLKLWRKHKLLATRDQRKRCVKKQSVMNQTPPNL